MSTVRLYNSLTRRVEDFCPLDPAGKRVLFYNCGPTVYGPFHIGNARNFVAMDVVRRWLMYRGYDVRFVQNITDIDDKIIRRGQAENRPPEDVAREFTALFHEHYRALGNLPATVHPKATEFLPQMVTAVQKLVERGYAYPSADGSVWYSVEKFPEYGKLSRKPLDQMREGERVAADQQALKRSPLDFALWKGSKPGEPAWDTPWGKGRPGWHIECTCMAIECLGQQIDIHSGGMDLQFPHHENEIAQSEALTGLPFARFWLHNGFLNIDGEKMSKSLGNVLTMDQVLQRMDPLTVRMFLVGAHYRMPYDITDESIHAARSGARRMVEADREASATLARSGAVGPHWRDVPEVAVFHERFAAAMDEDINTPEALGVLFQLVTFVNTQRAAAEKDTPGAMDRLAASHALLLELRGVLGITSDLEPKENLGGDVMTEQLLALLIEARDTARKTKQFAISDRIRDGLKALGIVLEDKPTGTVWKRVE
jgi:cysteinyl-tRNA synthetase